MQMAHRQSVSDFRFWMINALFISGDIALPYGCVWVDRCIKLVMWTVVACLVFCADHQFAELGALSVSGLMDCVSLTVCGPDIVPDNLYSSHASENGSVRSWQYEGMTERILNKCKKASECYYFAL